MGKYVMGQCYGVKWRFIRLNDAFPGDPRTAMRYVSEDGLIIAATIREMDELCKRASLRTTHKPLQGA